MKKRFIGMAVLLCVAAMLLSVALAQTVEAKAVQGRADSNSCGMWSVVSSPNQPNVSNGLSSVAAVSASDAWAVGSSGSQSSSGQTLIEQWNGTSWQIVTSPNPGSVYNTLQGISAFSATDIWAVGYDAGESGTTQTLVEHWNGTQWSAVTSPNPGSINNELFSVAAVSANDVWAVGFTANSTSQQTLIEHWNGSKWSVVASPNIQATDNYLTGVTAISTRDLWAVGYTFGSTSQTLIEHWNGSKWRIVSSPGPGASANFFEGVTAISSNDVWAIGEYLTSKGSSFQTLAEQWNGSTWSVVASPNPPGSTYDILQGITRVPATGQIWAVGNYTTRGNITETLAEFYC